MNKQQLAAKIWQSANRMRSKIEAHEYKDYILGFIFYKFLSDQEVAFCLREGMTEDELPELLVEEDSQTVEFVQDYLGYFIPYPHLYSTWITKGRDFSIDDVSVALSAFNRLIDHDHRKVFTGIFDTLQSGLSKLGTSTGERTRAAADLLHLIADIPMDGKQDYDVLGFIYEYLISNFAANAGKKAGEFYTPHEVSTLMAQIVAHFLEGRQDVRIYDPTSGSGSLLITIGKALARHQINTDHIQYYAQELKQNTYNLTRMNLVMRGIRPANIITRNGDTLEDDWPLFDDEDPSSTYHLLPVDAVVSNPPYSQQWNPEGKGNDPRYSAFGLAPKSKADYAFLLHDLYHLKADGVMTIVLPHGVLFRGNEEGQIRRQLIERGHIEAIIGLPANIFFGTGIPTIIMVLRQKRADSDVLIVDASKGFEKAGKNNRLRERDIRKVVDVVTSRATIEGFSRLVSIDEIRANDYNLNIPRYVDSSEPTESWDLYASMFGGVPESELAAFARFWDALPSLRADLFSTTDGYSQVRVDDIRAAIDANADVRAFRQEVAASVANWPESLHRTLITNAQELHLPTVHEALASELFERLSTVPLIDRYAAFQVLSDEWAVIEEDLEMLQSEGMGAATQVVPRMVAKKDSEVQDGWMGRIIPFDLVQSTILAKETARVSATSDRLSRVTSRMQELLENLSEEDKANATVSDGGDSWVAKEVKAEAKLLKKEVRSGAHFDEDSYEMAVLTCADLFAEEAALKKEAKAAALALEEHTRTTIESLSPAEVEDLLHRKWITPMIEAIAGMADAVVDDLVRGLSALVEKYSETFADVDAQIREAERELAAMLDDLTGSDADMRGIAEFKRLLGGAL